MVLGHHRTYVAMTLRNTKSQLYFFKTNISKICFCERRSVEVDLDGMFHEEPIKRIISDYTLVNDNTTIFLCEP